MSLTKPMLGLAVGGTLGLLDGLSGFLAPSLAPLMVSVITFSLLKGLLSGIAIGFVSQRVHSMAVGLLAGLGIAGALSLIVILRAGMALFRHLAQPRMAHRKQRHLRGGEKAVHRDENRDQQEAKGRVTHKSDFIVAKLTRGTAPAA